MKRNFPWPWFLAVLFSVVAVSFFTFLPICNLIFSCGCTMTGPAHCNVHHATGPRCPWCAQGNGVFALVYAMILFGVAGSIAGVLKLQKTATVPPRRPLALVRAIAAGLIGYVITSALVGLASALYFHYPTWFGIRL